jgi:hypothetical protein
MEIRQQDALDYHSKGRKGKIEVVATKPCRTQWDLSLAYTPGVAEPCLEIAKAADLSFETGPQCWGWETSGRLRESPSWRAKGFSSNASRISTSSIWK